MSGTAFGFQGQRFDSEMGLYFMKARYYDPKLGRFLQPEPVGYQNGLNLYKFAYNNPNNFKDPLGLAPSTFGDYVYSNYVAENWTDDELRSELAFLTPYSYKGILVRGTDFAIFEAESMSKSLLEYNPPNSEVSGRIDYIMTDKFGTPIYLVTWAVYPYTPDSESAGSNAPQTNDNTVFVYHRHPTGQVFSDTQTQRSGVLPSDTDVLNF